MYMWKWERSDRRGNFSDCVAQSKKVSLSRAKGLPLAKRKKNVQTFSSSGRKKGGEGSLNCVRKKRRSFHPSEPVEPFNLPCEGGEWKSENFLATERKNRGGAATICKSRKEKSSHLE